MCKLRGRWSFYSRHPYYNKKDFIKAALHHKKMDIKSDSLRSWMKINYGMIPVKISYMGYQIGIVTIENIFVLQKKASR